MDESDAAPANSAIPVDARATEPPDAGASIPGFPPAGVYPSDAPQSDSLSSGTPIVLPVTPKLPPPANASYKKTPASPPPPSGGVKETLESILIAFILAFIFRAFVLEPFVIPTGSMAPTLLGAHLRYTCPDCGYRFDCNYTAPGTGDDLEIPDHAGEKFSYAVRCPNCALRLPLSVDPPVYNGDRILVLKYLYLLQDPQRWDVVVFKSPDRPAEFNYSQNYIKRLVGKPKEWLMVLDGDIYVADEQEGPYKIQTKTRSAQESLWRVVYDNDHHPLNQPQYVHNGRADSKWEQPWRDVGGDVKWDTGDANNHITSHAFTFKGLQGTGILEFDPTKNHQGGYAGFRDWLPYDQTSDNATGQGQNIVRDLKLEFDYTRQAGDGLLRAKLSKFDDYFYMEIAPKTVKLVHKVKDNVVGETTAALPTRVPGPLRVEFSNVDYQVTVRINGTDLIQTNIDQYHPNFNFLKDWDLRGRPGLIPPSVAIAAEGQECHLEHVSLWRDIYYTPVFDSSRDPSQGGPHNPAHMGPDEYFVCGDNSALSFDSRRWTKPTDLPNESLFAEPGRVPGRFLLGKAFFVYWPAGYRPTARLPGLVPNFGEMRFIR